MQMQSNQWTVLGLLIFLLGLEAVRSQTVRNFFKSAANSANLSLSATAHGQTAPAPSTAIALDWHLLAYWGIGGLLLVALAGPAPQLTTAILVLIIVEELLVNWKDYAPLLNLPVK